MEMSSDSKTPLVEAIDDYNYAVDSRDHCLHPRFENMFDIEVRKTLKVFEQALGYGISD